MPRASVVKDGMARDPRRRGGHVGRPSKYRAEARVLARNLALLGCTNKRMSEIMGVTLSVFESWMQKYPDFREAIKDGRDHADVAVARSLYQRAVGYSYPDVHIAVSKTKDGIEVVQTPITKHYPPDITACIFWLANRQRGTWQHVAKIEHAGPNGGPIPMRLDLSQLSDADLATARRLGLVLRSGADGGGAAEDGVNAQSN